MKKVEILVPEKVMPKKDLENPCPCQDVPVKMKLKKGILTWIKKDGDHVEEGDLICEGEVEKKTIEFFAPATGILRVDKKSSSEFMLGDRLGDIEVEEVQQTILLYLISGFLGAGKTTFLKKLLLKTTDKRIGIIVNEFGSVGIDGKELQNGDYKMVEINNGSIFCACLKDGFRKTLSAFLSQPIDILFVEASGMADPSGMSDLLKKVNSVAEEKQTKKKEIIYGGNICLVDASGFLDYCDIFPAIQNQIKKSSFVVLNKTDQVENEKLESLHQKISEINNTVFIYDTVNGEVPVDIINEKIKFDVEEGETVNKPWNRPITYIIQMNEYYSLEKAKEFAKELGEYAIRLKGYFMTDQGMAHADCVGKCVHISIVENNITKSERQTCIVVIGKNSNPYGTELEKLWVKHFPGNKLIYDEE